MNPLQPGVPLPAAPARLLLAGMLAVLAAGCSMLGFSPDRPKARAAASEPVEQAPLVTTRFTLDDPDSNLVGQMQALRARHKDTLIDIALAYHVGYDELVEANPGVDPWLPGEGTIVLVPSRFVLPDGPRKGIVLNVASKRLFYYPPVKKGEAPVVYTFPVSIGREGWATPLGGTKIVSKKKDPVWTVPASIRKEHAEAGDPLPAVVPPGPDNPLGRYAMRLAIPGDYLIHGTNKPAGIGMRASHGCIRMNPDHIEWLYGQASVGLPVFIVNQPLLVGVRGSDLYVEAHPALDEDQQRRTAALLKDVEKHMTGSGGEGAGGGVDYERLASIVKDRLGYPLSIMVDGPDQAATVAAVPRVENIVTYEWFAEGEAESGAAPADAATERPQNP